MVGILTPFACGAREPFGAVADVASLVRANLADATILTGIRLAGDWKKRERCGFSYM